MDLSALRKARGSTVHRPRVTRPTVQPVLRLDLLRALPQDQLAAYAGRVIDVAKMPVWRKGNKTTDYAAHATTTKGPTTRPPPPRARAIWTAYNEVDPRDGQRTE